MSSIAVRAAEPEDVADVERWVQGLPGAMIYAAPRFGSVLESMVPGRLTVLVARRAGAIVGILPFMAHEHAALGCVVNSLPWYGTHGGCQLGDDGDDAARRALLAAYRDELSRRAPLSATMVLTPAETVHLDSYRDVLAPRELDHRIGQITPLPAGGADQTDAEAEAALMATIRQKTRNLVRKSLKQGFTEVVTDEEWAWRFLHETHVENMTAIGGKPKPWEHFEAFRRELPAANRRLSVAMLGDEPVAGMLLFAFSKTVEYITPVIKVEHRAAQPLSFLIWRGMTWAVDQGYSAWNWGGTWHTQRSLHHFKAGWGADDRPYTYVINAPEDAPAAIGRRLPELGAAFPYYYLYPFDRLDRA